MCKAHKVTKKHRRLSVNIGNSMFDVDTITTMNAETEQEVKGGAFRHEFTYGDLLELPDPKQVVTDILNGTIKVEGTTDPINTATIYVEDLEEQGSDDTSELWDMIKFERDIFVMTNFVF